ncbi:MAG: PD-(D/E)XK nuclease family protein [Aminipila sp.]
MLNIYYARENIDKDKFIYENISGKTFLIVPNQFTLQTERNAFEYLNVKGLIDLDVISPSRLCMRILREVGGEKVSRLDKYGRHMLLSKIVSDNKDALETFNGLEDKASFIDMVNNLISEMKQHNTSVEEMTNILNSLESDSVLYRKLKDIKVIYERYDDQIKNKYIDTEDYLEHCIGKINKSQLIKDREIWVHGFDYFAPKNMKLLRELIDNAINVNVIMTYCDDCRDSEIFELTGGMIEKIKNLAEEISKPYSINQIGDEYKITRKTNEELQVIESELFSVPSKKYMGQCQAITLVKAANPYAEAETAAAYICKLLREENFRYRDIAVICNDMETRGSIISRVFREYGLCPFMDKKRSILHNPVISMNLYLLNLAMGRLNLENIIGFVKTGLTGLSQDMIEQLENYAYKFNIKGGMWRKPFFRGVSEYEPEEITAINEAREFIIKIIDSFSKDFNKAVTVGDKIAVLYSFLKDKLAIPEKLETIIEEQNLGGYYEASIETAQIWKFAVEIYDQMVTVMGSDRLETKELEIVLKAGFEAVEIGMLPGTIDEIIVGTMQRTRTGKIKALVVLGANDGILPSAVSGDGILNDDEKNILFSNHIEICKLDELRIMEEKLAMYRNLSKPEKFLFMSYSVSDNEGKELKPSSIFNKIAGIYDNAKIEKDILNSQDILRRFESKNNGIKHLTEALRKHISGEKLEDCFKVAMDWYKSNENSYLDNIKNGLFFKVKSEKLSFQEAERLYKREEQASLSLSPSRLEKFGRCPFAHFINYGLRPEEKRVYEIASREMGDIYHLCLMKLSEHLTEKDIPITDEKSKWKSITEDNCRQLINDYIDKESLHYREGILAEGNEGNYKAGRMKRICGDAAWILIEHVRQGKIEKIFFESEFGRRYGKQFPAIEVKTSQGSVFIEGKIDRVDILPDNYVKVIDYKSGNEKFNVEEAKAGWRLQLMLYLKAAMDNIPNNKQDNENKAAGVFYFKLDEPMIDASNIEHSRLKEKITEEMKKAFKLDGVLVNEPQVIDSIAGEFVGTSEVLPIRRNKDGIIVETSKGKLLSEEDFKELQSAVEVKIQDLCNELACGNADIAPKKSGNETACRYCKYQSICKFDTAFEGCKYTVIK